jgi:hypothetical protein
LLRFGNSGTLIVHEHFVAMLFLGDLYARSLSVGDRIFDKIAHGAPNLVGSARDRSGRVGFPIDGLPEIVEICAEAIYKRCKIDASLCLAACASRCGKDGLR